MESFNDMVERVTREVRLGTATADDILRLLEAYYNLLGQAESDLGKEAALVIQGERQIVNQARNISILSARLRAAGLSDQIEPNDKEVLG